MTKDEAAQPGKELERAHGVSYALRAQLWQESAQHDSWLQMLDELEEAKPWMYLPEGKRWSSGSGWPRPMNCLAASRSPRIGSTQS